MELNFKGTSIHIDTINHIAMIDGEKHRIIPHIKRTGINRMRPYISFMNHCGSYVLSGLDAVNDLDADQNDLEWRKYLINLIGVYT